MSNRDITQRIRNIFRFEISNGNIIDKSVHCSIVYNWPQLNKEIYIFSSSKKAIRSQHNEIHRSNDISFNLCVSEVKRYRDPSSQRPSFAFSIMLYENKISERVTRKLDRIG